MSRNWQRVPLGEVCEIQQGNNLAVSKLTGGEFPVYGANGIVGYFDDWNFDREVVALGCRGSCGTLHSVKKKAWLANNVMAIWPKNDSLADLGFIQLSLEVADLKSTGVISGQVQPQITRKSLSPLQIALPRLLEQRRIVDLISSVDSYIAALQQQADAARVARSAVLSDLLSAGGDDWVHVALHEVVELGRDRLDPRSIESSSLLYHWSIPELDLSGGPAHEQAAAIGSHKFRVSRDAVVFSLLNPRIPRFALIDGGEDVVCSTEFAVMFPKSTIQREFLFVLATSTHFQTRVASLATGTTKSRERIRPSDLEHVSIALPSLAEQRRIVDVVSSMDDAIQSTEHAVADAKSLRSGLLSDLLSGEHEIPESYDRLLGVA